MLIISAGLLCFYYIWYFCAMCNNLRLIMVTDLSTKITFVSSQIVHGVTILAVMLGVFSRHFANGGIQLFFIGMINVYVITLCILNAPIRRKKKAEDADGVEMQASVSQDQVVRPDDIVLDLQEEEQKVEDDIQGTDKKLKPSRTNKAARADANQLALNDSADDEPKKHEIEF